MTETDLIAIIKAHRRDSLGAEDGDLSNERAKALDHYHGRPYGNGMEVDGRSQVVSRDLSETVDWALPTILRAFVQSGALGEFTPVSPDDVEKAQQETDYTNQVMMEDNAGFMVLHDAIKDTLILKNGYTKRIWDESEKVEEKEYCGLTLDQVQQLLTELAQDGAEVEIIGQNSEIEYVAGMPVEMFEIKLRIKRKEGRLLWLAVPTEEVRVSKKCRGSLQESPFVEHVTKKTRSDLVEMGLPRDFVSSLPAYGEDDNDGEKLARDSTTDESDNLGQVTGDRSMDEVEFCEAYLRVDYDGDGIAELRKVVTVGGRIPEGEDWNEPIHDVPMTGYAMKRVPHRHVGESLDDELADLQEIKTVLQRQLLDNVYLTNSSEVVLNTDYANVKDFMTRTPGGIKRMKGQGVAPSAAVMPLVTQSIVDKILPVVDYMDKVKEIRTGIRPGSDMDPDILRETTKGAFLEHLNRASQKIELITRMIAETGVKEDFRLCHAMLLRHQDTPRVVQMRGKWVPVSPCEWRERTNLRVRVGLGTGNEEEKRQKLMLLTQLQAQTMAVLMGAPQPVYAKAHALFEDIAKSMGMDVPEKYAIGPESQEYQMLMQAKQQQGDPAMAAEQAKLQSQERLESQRMTMQAEVDRNRQQVEMQQQAAKMQMEKELALFKADLDRQMEQARMQIKAETDIVIARINAQAKLDAAQLSAAAVLSPQQEAASDGAVDA